MPAEKPKILSVSALTRRIKALLEREVGQVWVAGEISNWTQAASGHAYFTLKDADCQLGAVMWRGKVSKVKFTPKSGLEVVLHGRVSVYEPRGNYQIIVDRMEPRGIGALQLAFEQLKKKLHAEGLFDEAHKKPLPMMPKRIGVVTSPTGAAFRDILNVLGRRYANVHVILSPARVQGEAAAGEIAEAIRKLDAYGVDVMIVGRGGGSLEDLWPFNEEEVVRAIFAAKTPIISAVGHEIDTALTDFVADLRAPTPSAAAELVVKEYAVLVEKVTLLKRRLARGTRQQLERTEHRLRAVRSSYAFSRPEELFRQHRQRCDELGLRLDAAMRGWTEDGRRRVADAARALVLLSPSSKLRESQARLEDMGRRLAAAGKGLPGRDRANLRNAAGRLEALSPLAILSRGYALARKMPEGELVRRAVDLNENDTLRLRFGEGEALVTVRAMEEADDAQERS